MRCAPRATCHEPLATCYFTAPHLTSPHHFERAHVIKILATLTLAAAMLPAHAVTNIGVLIGINARGQYGRIDIGN